jgi:hypothetical protein
VIDRRAFIGSVAGSLVVTRSVVEAQPATKVYRIGYLGSAPVDSLAAPVDALMAVFCAGCESWATPRERT